jgi:hypothetical protein
VVVCRGRRSSGVDVGTRDVVERVEDIAAAR